MAEPKRGRIPRIPTSPEKPFGPDDARGSESAAPPRTPDLDPELVQRARQGDLEAFEALYRACVGRVLALCTRLCGDRDRAQDLTQEVFLRVWQRIERFEGRSGFFTWLYRVTVNRVTDALRAEMRREAREVHSNIEPLPPRSDGGKRRIEPLDLERALACLPAGARVVFVLHDVEGYRHAEIAAMTGIAVGTSKAQLHRARSMLRRRLV